MNKTELTAIAKKLALPTGWKVRKVYPSVSGRKTVAEYDSIIVVCPIAERMNLSGSQLGRKIGGILRQLNALRPARSRRWEEFGSGYGFGEPWYEITFGREVA